jgi:radical SAM superfamily enzyme YgiQ (UPF0313 family)
MISEIRLKRDKYRARGLRTICLCDETFGLDFERLERFCELYQKEGFSRELKWVCETRADLVRPEWARTVARAGCVMVNLGIESGDDHIRTAVYKKNISQEAIRQAVHNLNACGIVYGFYFMIGCPQDTRASLNASLKLVRETGPLRAYFTFYDPLPKTALYAEICRDRVDWTVAVDSLRRLPRVATPHVRPQDFRRFLRAVRLAQLCRFFTLGFRMKKFAFISDVIKFVFSIGHCRKLPLSNRHIKSELEQKTILKYVAEKQSHWGTN